MTTPTHPAGEVSANRQTYQAKRAGDRARYAEHHDEITTTRQTAHASRRAEYATDAANHDTGPTLPVLNIFGPVAYIRRSVARRADPGDISREFQTDAVRALANGDGPTLRILDGDWGRSAATEKTDHRLVFLALMEAVEAGRVTAIYAYSADRLARSVEWSSRLWNACARVGTAIVTTTRRFDPANRADDGGWTIWHYEAMGNESALRGMVAKSSASAAKRKERGDVIGRAPYGFHHAMIAGRSQLVPREGEDPAVVVAAFEETGTYNGAARLLNGPKGEIVTGDRGDVIGVGKGLPTRFGQRWDATAVRRIYLRERPEARPLAPRKGSASRGRRYFSGLLRCPHADLHPGTPILTTGGTAWGPRYLCRSARVMADHPKPYIVSEAKVLEWAKVEIARFGKHWDVAFVNVSAANSGQIVKLERRRKAVIENFEDGDISRDEKKLKLAKIDATLTTLEPASRAIRRVDMGKLRLRSAIDWDLPPGEVNARLRELWDHVELDPETLLPVKAVYHPGLSPEDQEIAIEQANEADKIDARERETTRQRRKADHEKAMVESKPPAEITEF
jgi:DNA invertase Pin-like site-specific DNA recombinase